VVGSLVLVLGLAPVVGPEERPQVLVEPMWDSAPAQEPAPEPPGAALESRRDSVPEVQRRAPPPPCPVRLPHGPLQRPRPEVARPLRVVSPAVASPEAASPVPEAA
jgi:hypothetical protein